MLGYSNVQSSHDAFVHHNVLKSRAPSPLHKQLDYAYNWINDRNFMLALDNQTVEGWQWLERSMAHPPNRVLQKFASESTSHVTIHSHIHPLQSTPSPKCRVCSKPIAGSVHQKCKFSMVICKCDRLWCHQECADASVLATPQCSACKEYFILSPYCASLRSTIATK